MTEFLEAKDQIGFNYGFYHDSIDMIRQGHQLMFDLMYESLKKAYRKKDIKSFQYVIKY